MIGQRAFQFGNKRIGEGCPVYFIADIAANHDGSLERAKSLISHAKEAGADAVKFQHHDVNKYVSDEGFKNIGKKLSHQTEWKKSIYQVYKDAQVPLEWTHELKSHCRREGLEFFTTPYDLDLVDSLASDVPGFKIGSGDINWHEMLAKVASVGKPMLFATGAASLQEVVDAYMLVSKTNDKVVLMQCNTNYTGSAENFKYINLNVLKVYKSLFPEVVLGLSDHTPGAETVLGAIALGAKVIEKHFTDDNSREGPDHPFSMNPMSWKNMVRSSRLLECALGSSIKKVEDNERETVVLQRRCIRATCAIPRGAIISREMFEFQRPAPEGSIQPNDVSLVLGRTAAREITAGAHIRFSDIVQ